MENKRGSVWIWVLVLIVVVSAVVVYFSFFTKQMISSLDRENKAEFPEASFLMSTEEEREGETTFCQDEDGYDLFSKSKTNYGHLGGNVGGQEDYCDFYTEGSGNRGYLRESYCEGDIFIQDIIDCGEGYVCREGKCVIGDESMPICIDTDGGKDENIKGSLSSAGGSGEDSCYMNGGMGDECSGVGCGVYEYYCDGELRAWEEIGCPNGCRDGACVS